MILRLRYHPRIMLMPADESIRHSTPGFRRTNLAMFAAGAATFSLLYCVQPLMPLFARNYGVSAAQAALSLSLSTAVLAAAMLFAGAISDAVGRKRLMSVSLFSSSLLVLFTAIAPDWRSMLFLRTLLGLSLSGLPAVAMTYLSEEMHADSIGLAMGLYISGSAVGGMAGRLITGVIADYLGWRSAIATIGALGFATAWVFARSLPASRHFVARPLHLHALVTRFRAMFFDLGLRWLFAAGFLLLGVLVTIYNYIGYRLMAPPYRLSQAAVGLIFSVYLVGTVSSAWIGHLAGRLGRRKVLWSMYIVMLLGVALTLPASLAAVLAGMVVLTFGFFGAHSILSSWVGRRAGEARAQAASMYLFAYYLGASIAGAAGGLFYAERGWTGVAQFVIALLAVGLGVACRLYFLAPLARNVASGEVST